MIASLIGLSLAMQVQPSSNLRQEFAPIAFLVGHCWRGDLPDGRGEDVHCFESVYGGQHVRDRHEVRGPRGLYSGETLYSWDGSAGTVTYTYWNSTGGVSRGTMRPEAGRLSFGDEHYRGADGRQLTISTYWQAIGEESYEAVSTGEATRRVRYRRVAVPVTISEEEAGDGTRTLLHETIVEAPVARVWTAISTVEGWRGWAVPVAWMDAAEPVMETSYSPTANPGDANNIRQRIVASVPGRMMAFRTIKAPDGFPNFDTFSRVVSVFQLEPVGEGRTRVRLIGAGYADDDAGRQLITFFRDGNRISLERLAEHFRTGPLDWSRLGN